MSLLLHAMEVCGLLLTASSVRMVSGTAAALVSLVCMTATRFFSGGPVPLLFPVALVMILLLRTDPKGLWIGFGAVAVVPLAVAATWGHFSGATLTAAHIVVALPSAIWLVLGFRDENGAALAMAGPPLALLLVDRVSACVLLIGSGVALAGLVVKSYRLKRL